MAEIARDRSSARIECLIQAVSQSDNACQCFTGLPPRGLDGPAGKQAARRLDLSVKFPFFYSLYGVKIPISRHLPGVPY